MKRRDSSHALTERVSPDARHITTPSQYSTPRQSENRVSVTRYLSATPSTNSARELSALILALPPLRTRGRGSVDHGSDTGNGGREEAEEAPQNIQRRITFL